MVFFKEMRLLALCCRLPSLLLLPIRNLSTIHCSTTSFTAMPPKRKVADSSGDVVREEAKKASTFKKARSTKDIGSDAGSVCSTGGIKVGTDGTKAKPKPKPKPKGERNAVTIETGNEAGSEVSSSTPAGVIPKRNKRGQLVFADYPSEYRSCLSQSKEGSLHLMF